MATRAALSKRQDECLAALWRYVDAHGYAPSMRELGAALGISSTGHVTYLLRALERGGYLSRDYGTARGLRLLRRTRRPGA